MWSITCSRWCPTIRCRELHETIKHDLPPPNTSIWDAYKEMVRAVMRQRRDPSYFVKKELPPTARPYLEDLHDAVPDRASA